MDYQGDLESRRPIVEFGLHFARVHRADASQLQTVTGVLGTGVPDPARFFADLEEVANADYENAQVTATRSNSSPILSLYWL